MSAFADGVLIWREVTHEKSLVGCAGEAGAFVQTMCALGNPLGNRRGFPSGHTRPRTERDGDLRWWSERVGTFQQEEKTAHANNRSPSTLSGFHELRRGV